MLRGNMQGGAAAKNLRRTVTRFIMKERTAALQLVLEMRQLDSGLIRELVVLAADRQSDPVASRNDNGGRPDFHVEFYGNAWFEWLKFIVSMIRPVGLRQLSIQLAMRSPQPTLGDRRVWVDGPDEHNFAQVRCVDLEHQEQIGIGRTRGDKKLGGNWAGDFGFLLQRRK